MTNSNLWAAAILAIGAIVAAAIFGGRYTIIGSRDRLVYVVDRYTGAVKYCAVDQCAWSTVEPAK